MRLAAEHRLALEQLYEPLRRFAGAVGPPEIEPDDLVQEALVGALRRRPLGEYDDLGAYLRRSIVSLSTDHRRRFGRRRRVMSRLGPAEHSSTPTYPSDVAELAALPSDQRAVLYLGDVEGYPAPEIARMLGISADAVRARASRARRRLRMEMQEEMG
ncbi:MAG TPA: sigma-70 family RNA polymerase sigma factor [Acidimicrobiales bacterium]